MVSLFEYVLVVFRYTWVFGDACVSSTLAASWIREIRTWVEASLAENMEGRHCKSFLRYSCLTVTAPLDPHFLRKGPVLREMCLAFCAFQQLIYFMSL